MIAVSHEDKAHYRRLIEPTSGLTVVFAKFAGKTVNNEGKKKKEAVWPPSDVVPPRTIPLDHRMSSPLYLIAPSLAKMYCAFDVLIMPDPQRVRNRGKQKLH
jgi:hypothetical protein